MSSRTVGPQGEKVVLKVIEPVDLNKIYDWKNDYELLGRINAHPLPTSEQQVQEWFDRCHSDKNQVLFGIYSREGEFAGIIRLMFIDWINRNCDLGIYIGDPKWRGKGIGKETVQLILKYAFGELNLHKVSLKVAQSNSEALATYKSCGFKEEGVLKDQFWFDGKFHDVILMGNIRP